MSANSKIEWTDHTFNPWWGCTKVSPACELCYAETWAKRTGHSLWGPRARRRFFGDKHWAEPISWNREAEEAGARKRVFCASMADVFEDRSELDEQRERLWRLIEATPALDWLLLTKRPENVREMVDWDDGWPRNVWLGSTVENQAVAVERIPALLATPAAIHFVSCEPLLGPLNIEPWMGDPAGRRRARAAGVSESIDWVIAGGESGGRARPTDPRWLRGLRQQCRARRVAFHFKQWGVWGPGPKRPQTVDDLIRLGKATAGRVLDGRTWDELPLRHSR